MLLLARDRFKLLALGPLGNAGVETAGKGLLSHLSLLFVPAGVGVVQELDLLASHGIAIILVLALSVVITLLATVLTFRLVSRLLRQQDAR
jgi:holin-like protein